MRNRNKAKNYKVRNMTSKWVRQPDFSHLSLEELGVYRETVVVGGGGRQVERIFDKMFLLNLLCFVIKEKIFDKMFFF